MLIFYLFFIFLVDFNYFEEKITLGSLILIQYNNINELI